MRRRRRASPRSATAHRGLVEETRGLCHGSIVRTPGRSRDSCSRGSCAPASATTLRTLLPEPHRVGGDAGTVNDRLAGVDEPPFGQWRRHVRRAYMPPIESPWRPPSQAGCRCRSRDARPSPVRSGSESDFATKAPTGKPPPIDLARVIRSGVTPSSKAAPPYPAVMPV